MICTKSQIQYFELKTLSFRYKGHAANPMLAAYPENQTKLNFTFCTKCRLNVKTFFGLVLHSRLNSMSR